MQASMASQATRIVNGASIRPEAGTFQLFSEAVCPRCRGLGRRVDAGAGNIHDSLNDRPFNHGHSIANRRAHRRCANRSGLLSKEGRHRVVAHAPHIDSDPTRGHARRHRAS